MAKNNIVRTVKPDVMSFRLSSVQTQQLASIRDQDPIVGVKSNNQLARKIVSDYLAGRLVYKNKSDSQIDLDVYGSAA